MRISSPAFNEGAQIPAIYTCEGDDRSPELVISGVPAHAKSLVLVCEDPDAPDPKAPKMTWIHWLLFNLPPAIKNIPERVDVAKTFPQATVGSNSWHKQSYGGPCPPIGSHRYYFKLYAVDIRLNLDGAATKDTVMQAMQGHIVGQAQLMGRYQKKAQ